jgi:hypothetical protein
MRHTCYRRALIGSQLPHLTAIACSKVPDGHDHWTLHMLAGKAVEMGCVEKISPEAIRVLDLVGKVEPLLRWVADQAIVTIAPLEDVVATLLQLVPHSRDGCRTLTLSTSTCHACGTGSGETSSTPSSSLAMRCTARQHATAVKVRLDRALVIDRTG